MKWSKVEVTTAIGWDEALRAIQLLAIAAERGNIADGDATKLDDIARMIRTTNKERRP